jgi:CheY-like chemotaxis protein
MSPSDHLPKPTCRIEPGPGGGEQAPGSFHFATDELLSLLGHELRTPLAGTLGMLELVLAGDLAADQRSALELANASARSMLRLVEDLHDLARMETGRLELHESPFEVRSWVEKMAGELTFPGAVEVSVGVDPQLPELLIGDSDRIAHLVMNLVEVFLKQGRFRHVVVNFALECDGDGSFLLLTVAGPGGVLSAEDRSVLLQTCGKVSPVPLIAFRDLGIKQAVIRNLTASLGAALWPAEESATRDIQALAIPIQVPAEYTVEADKPRVEGTPPEAGDECSGVNILLVEDDDAIRKLVELLLQQRDWQVTAVADGVQALELLQRGHFDLVLMDIRMPRLDGLETTRRIRRREQILGIPALPIVGMTAHAAAQDRALCLESGMDDHLSKPIVSDRLYSVIEKYLVR